MDKMELVAEIQKLNRSHSIRKWVDLAFGILIVFPTLYLIDIKYDAEYDGFFKFILDIEPHQLLTGLGGAIIGMTWRNWNGNRELKLLNKIVQDK